jgi:hypothetical protein
VANDAAPACTVMFPNAVVELGQPGWPDAI